MSRRKKSTNYGLPQITPEEVRLFRSALRGDLEAAEVLHRRLGLAPWYPSVLSVHADDELLPEAEGVGDENARFNHVIRLRRLLVSAT